MDLSTVEAVQVGKVENIGRAALCSAVCAATYRGLTLLDGRVAEGQSEKRCHSDEGLHYDG